MNVGLTAIDRPRIEGDTGRTAITVQASAPRVPSKETAMASVGQTLVNPASGERITFRTTATMSDGELVSIDLELPPGGRVPAGLHIHPLQEERFEVVRGSMRFRKRRERIVAGPGDVVVVAPGVPHDFANAGDETALVRVDIRPALKMEQLFETAVALAEDGRTMLKGIPKPFDLALFTRAFEQEVQAAFPPRWLATARARAAGPAGRSPPPRHLRIRQRRPPAAAGTSSRDECTMTAVVPRLLRVPGRRRSAVVRCARGIRRT